MMKKFRRTMLTIFIMLTTTYGYGQGEVTPENNRIYILAVDWNADGSQIAAVGLNPTTYDGYIYVFDAVTGEPVYMFEAPSGGFASVDWSPDSRFLAVGGNDQTVRIVDTQSGEIVTALFGHRWIVSSVDWNSDGTRLVSSGTIDQQVILWDTVTYEPIRRLEIGDPWAVAFSPDDQSIAIAGLPGLLNLPADLEIPEGSERQHYRQASGYLGTLAWSHDGTRIAFGNQTFRPTTGEQPNPQVWVVDSNNGSVLSNFEVQHGEDIFGITWSPDDAWIASYSTDGWVRVWEAASGIFVDSFRGNADFIERGLGFSPYGGRLAFGGFIANEEAISTSEGDSRNVEQILASNGVRLVVPAPSLERLQTIADACNAPIEVVQGIPTGVETEELVAFIAQVEGLPENTIPLACATDLIAVAEALQSE